VRALLILLPILLLAIGSGSLAAEEKDSCIDCHSKREFLVTNKKLYDYYREWESSVHSQEEVSCGDCHGGNPDISDKSGAHGGTVGEGIPQSAVNFRNIPETCGQAKCHADFLNAYRKSAHFEHLVADDQEEQGPNCVTCHGSINVGVLNVNTVEKACARCHNDETENNPEIPEKAKVILGKFRSISRYYRYIAVRGDPIETRAFFEKADAEISELEIGWHTFDLEEVEKLTEKVLTLLREKRNEARETARKQKAP
jgi:hypothetical protein